LLGVALHALKRTDEAIECCEKAIAIRPHYAIALNNALLGLCQSKRISMSL
jgi:tetratricopeptide (TPR) repeat protein